MLLGPVFRYELYSIARRTRYFWLRGFFGVLLLFVMWMCYSSYAYSYYNSSGQLSIDETAQLADSFFQSFAWLGTLAILMIGPALSAGVIATERERRTIEYLFATDLSNAEIILSKLAARLLLLGLLLMTALPVLAIFRLMGGIAGDRLIACFLMLASTAIVVTSAAIAVSVWSPRGRDALGRIYLVILAALLLPLLFTAFSATGVVNPSSWLGERLGRIAGWLGAVNPIFSLASMSAGVGFHIDLIWKMMIAHGVLSLILIALAVSSVRRVHLRNISGGEGAAKRGRLAFEFPRWRLPLGNRPMLWKEIFARTASTRLGFLGRIAMFLIIAGLFWCLGYFYLEALQHSGYREDWFDETSLGIGAALGCGILLLCGARAATLVTYEKERDTWLSILSTPLTGYEILSAKLAGNLYAFRWLAAVQLFVWLLAVTLHAEFLLIVPFLVATQLVLMVFSSLVGLLYSLRLSSSLRASSATMGTLFYVGGGYFLCCCSPFMFGGGDGLEYFMLAPCAPLLLIAPSQFIEPNYVQNEFISNYIIGMIGYCIVTVLLWVALEGGFDKWSGRNDGERQSAEPIEPIEEIVTLTPR